MKPFKLFLFSIAIVGGVYSFAQNDSYPIASTTLESKSGSNVKGEIRFQEASNGLDVVYNLSGLNPERLHGFHIHEMGDCSAVDAVSAGKHYIEIFPTGGTSADSTEKHAGDLPQIRADSKGNAQGQIFSPRLSVNKMHPVVGRAIIVHAGPDDVTRKSAPRVGCGVIRMVETD